MKDLHHQIKIKKKKYLVDVRSHVSAEMIVFANSKEEAWKIASRDMEESLEKQIAGSKPHSMIQNLSGYTEAMKSSIQILQK